MSTVGITRLVYCPVCCYGFDRSFLLSSLLKTLMNAWPQLLVQMHSALMLLALTSAFPAEWDSEAGMDSAVVCSLSVSGYSSCSKMLYFLFRQCYNLMTALVPWVPVSFNNNWKGKIFEMAMFSDMVYTRKSWFTVGEWTLNLGCKQHNYNYKQNYWNRK